MSSSVRLATTGFISAVHITSACARFTCCLRVVTANAQRLKIRFVPEQRRITFMRRHMVQHGREIAAPNAQWVLHQERFPYVAEPSMRALDVRWIASLLLPMVTRHGSRK